MCDNNQHDDDGDDQNHKRNFTQGSNKRFIILHYSDDNDNVADYYEGRREACVK